MVESIEIYKFMYIAVFSQGKMRKAVASPLRQYHRHNFEIALPLKRQFLGFRVRVDTKGVRGDFSVSFRTYRTSFLLDCATAQPPL